MFTFGVTGDERNIERPFRIPRRDFVVAGALRTRKVEPSLLSPGGDVA